VIPFGDRLAAAMYEYGPLCVGIDPHPNLLQAWGLEDSAESLRTFTTAVYEGCAPYAAALKPQVALIVADAKRGDIGSTMKAYADAWLGTSSPLGTDSVTLSPYLGFESLRPALDAATANQRGTFVLALTSNPEGKSVQHVGKAEDTGAVAKQVIAAATVENTAQTWERMGSCGLVVGATVGEALKELAIDLSTFNGPILSPGYGAQGASAEELYRIFAGVESQVLVNSSRSVLSAGPQPADLARAAQSARDDLVRARGTS